MNRSRSDFTTRGRRPLEPQVRAPDGRLAEPVQPGSFVGLLTLRPANFRGLSFGFWVLQLHLFITLTLVDHHYPLLHDFRWRSMSGLLAAVTAVATMGPLSSRSGAGLLDSVQSRWLVAFLAATTASALWAYDPDLARNDYVDDVTSIASFFLVLVIVRTPRELAVTLLVVASALGIYLLIALREWFGGRYVINMGVTRMVGPGTTDANTFGATLAFSAPLIAWVGLHGRGWLFRLGAVVYWLLMIYCVFATSSRSSMILLILVTAWSIWRLPGGRRKLLWLGVIGVLSVVLVDRLSENQSRRLMSLLKSETYEEEQSTRGRIDGYTIAWKMFEERPLLGVGPGNWATFRANRIDGDTLKPHNLTGQLIATYGLAGTITFVGYVVATIAYGVRQARRRRRSNDPDDRAVGGLCSAGAFSLILMIVSGFGSHNLGRPSWFWVPALMVVAVTRIRSPASAPQAVPRGPSPVARGRTPRPS